MEHRNSKYQSSIRAPDDVTVRKFDEAMLRADLSFLTVAASDRKSSNGLVLCLPSRRAASAAIVPSLLPSFVLSARAYRATTFE